MAIKVVILDLGTDSSQSSLIHSISKDEIRIGRADLNDIVLDAESVSEEHLKLTVRTENGEKKLFIVDLKSANGTTLSQQRLEPGVAAEVEAGASIFFAQYLLRATIVESGTELCTKEIEADAEKNSHETAPEDLHEVSEAPVAQESNLGHNSACSVDDQPKLSSTDIQEAGTELRVLNFKAIRLCQIRGQVTSNGHPVRDAIVNAGHFGVARSAHDGSFSFNDIPEDSAYTITICRNGREKSEEVIHGKALTDQFLEVRLPPLVTIRGVVLHNGKPLAGVKVESSATGTAITDEQGRYEFQAVSPQQEYKLVACKEGYLISQAVLESSENSSAKSSAEDESSEAAHEYAALSALMRQMR